MNKLDRHEKLIKEINLDISDLLGEGPLPITEFIDMSGYEPWQVKLARKLLGLPDEAVEIINQYGDPIAAVVDKDPIEVPDGLDDKARAEIDATLERQQAQAAEIDAYLSSQDYQSVGDDTTSQQREKSSDAAYSNITVNFRGTTEISVIVGSGKEIKQKLSGSMSFTIDSFKETNQGYIMNLYNRRQFNRHTSLLLYCKDLGRNTQTNLIQLIYENGRFTGAPVRASFAIINIS